MIMETVYQTFQLQDSNWLPQKSHGSYWSREENKLFESALAIYDKNTADRWEKVAQMIPGKSVSDVINQYKELEDDVSYIEAGLVPTPGYLTSSFTLELGDDRDFDALRKKSARARSADHEKRKGVPWTEDEHRRFLMGLLKHGRGDWRSISRNFVGSKTPTQVASHAQKYFLRLNSGMRDKRRPSIHDITTTNITNPPPSDDFRVAAFDQFLMLPPPDKEASDNVVLDWNQHQNASAAALEPDNGNLFVPPAPYENLYATAYHGLQVRPHNPMFEVQSARQRIRG
uniref:Uncharacterized protein n=1 Tax=Kalanchoe fedtschenkoi TaxID=63787 RepID=A0A7N0TGW1_KALFE